MTNRRHCDGERAFQVAKQPGVLPPEDSDSNAVSSRPLARPRIALYGVASNTEP